MSSDVHYKRSRFATRLPADRLYTPAHFWILEHAAGVWRVGLTKFAGRMLGDVVDLGFEVRPADPVQLGDTIGWLEGFKARTDLYAVVTGTFAGANPDLEADIDLVDSDRYGRGWLYAVEGRPDPDASDVHGYVKVLDATIDRLRGRVK
jgi:glycine cleavage system H protein